MNLCSKPEQTRVEKNLRIFCPHLRLGVPDPAHKPDTHLHCAPGATPKFKVTFTNPPPPNHVLPSDADENGGYLDANAWVI